MKHADSSRTRPAVARDAALRRLRRTTQVSIAVMVALGGAFTAFAAGSTHTKKTVVRAPVRKAQATILTAAPAPPLVSAQASQSSDDSSAASAPAAPVSAPVPSYSPPVVVSGGS